MQGLHITADLFDCSATEWLAAEPAALDALGQALARQAGLAVVGSRFHGFGAGGGVTGVVLLAESHLALHTWPEQRAATLDVYVCNFSQDNSAKAEALVAALLARFGATRTQVQRLRRGSRPPP
jgi:S-adenosylmethionine decarboxylase proenzyme